VPKSEQISRTVLVLVEKKTKDFINKHSKKNYTPDAFGDLISAFYDHLSEVIKKKVDHDQEMIQICIDRAEEQLTDPLYARLFALEEDENQDLGLFCFLFCFSAGCIFWGNFSMTKRLFLIFSWVPERNTKKKIRLLLWLEGIIL